MVSVFMAPKAQGIATGLRPETSVRLKTKWWGLGHLQVIR